MAVSARVKAGPVIAINDIAECPADNEAKGIHGQAVRRRRKPPAEPRHHSKREEEERLLGIYNRGADLHAVARSRWSQVDCAEAPLSARGPLVFECGGAAFPVPPVWCPCFRQGVPLLHTNEPLFLQRTGT